MTRCVVKTKCHVLRNIRESPEIQVARSPASTYAKHKVSTFEPRGGNLLSGLETLFVLVGIRIGCSLQLYTYFEVVQSAPSCPLSDHIRL